MIGAVVMIFVAIWIYQTAIKAKMSNVIVWAAAAAAIFFVTQFMLIEVNVNVFSLDGSKTESKMMSSTDEACEDDKKASVKEGEKDDDMGQFKNSSCSVVHGNDRQDEERYLGFSGMLKSLYFELAPQILGFLLIAFLRLKFITKEAMSVGNLFGGIKEMFQSIKQSFKSPE
ncbi:MAG: hypothetical protein Q7U23_01895 [Methylococcales bacterium]|nr:hypothetical protein [Methylococcales bacterium]